MTTIKTTSEKHTQFINAQCINA